VRTGAGETSAIVNAGGTVFASTSLTCVILVLTADPGVIVRTGAVKTRAEILTAAVMHARIANAPLGRSFAPLAVSSRWASIKAKPNFQP
jgi:hypothetical protein